MITSQKTNPLAGYGLLMVIEIVLVFHPLPNQHGQEDSNPQPADLESAALPIELRPSLQDHRKPGA